MELNIAEYRKVRAKVFREIRASPGITTIALAEKLSQVPEVILKAIGDLKDAGWVEKREASKNES